MWHPIARLRSRPGGASDDPQDQKQSVDAQLTRLLRAWLLLVLLGGAEFAVSFLPLARPLRPLVMIPGVLMVVTVTVAFMELRRGPVLVRAFAVAAMLWLLVLLSLGSADPLTRTEYHVPNAQVK
jgi:hypothetical protein